MRDLSCCPIKRKTNKKQIKKGKKNNNVFLQNIQYTNHNELKYDIFIDPFFNSNIDWM